jgi:hypothetical protein
MALPCSERGVARFRVVDFIVGIRRYRLCTEVRKERLTGKTRFQRNHEGGPGMFTAYVLQCMVLIVKGSNLEAET